MRAAPVLLVLLFSLSACVVRTSARGGTRTTHGRPPAGEPAGTGGTVTTPGTAPTTPTTPPTTGTAAGTAPSTTTGQAEPPCTSDANLCLEANIHFAAEQEFMNGYVTVKPARTTGERDANGRTLLTDLATGQPVATKRVWAAHRPSAGEPKLGQLVVVFDSPGAGNVYQPPRTRAEARAGAWWLARVVNVDTLPRHVQTSGGYLAGVDALFIAEEKMPINVTLSGTEDRQWFRPDLVLVADKDVPKTGWVTAYTAIALTGGQANQYLVTLEGTLFKTRHAWKTRQATPAELKVGTPVFILDKMEGGAYVGPADRRETYGMKWWGGTITDVKDLTSGFVMVGGDHRVKASDVRVVAR